MATPEEQILAGIAGAGVSAAVVAATYFGCKYIYRKLNELPEYSKDALRRHDQLVALYRRIFDLPIPTEWTLAPDGKRPSYKFDLTSFSETLDVHMLGLRIKSTTIRLSVCSILNTITQLLATLDARWVGRLSGSSVEELFFTEIARMLLEKLPKLSFDDDDSMRELRKILHFCQEMKLLIPPEGKVAGLALSPRNNATAGLKDIIGNLNGVMESAEALIKAATFVRRIEALDNAVSSMAADAFNILTLLVSGNHDHESILPVLVFLDKEQTHRPDLLAFKKYKLAMWIEQTLDAAGIKKGNFTNTKRLTLAEADRHLEGECSADAACELPTKLLDAKHKEWGHWSYSIIGVDDAKVQARLSNIREILRDILKIYHLRGLLTNTRKVAPTSGEAWLYGDPTGLAIVATLMEVAEELASKLYRSLDRFMVDYESIFEHAKSTAGRLSETDHDYIATNKAIRHLEGVAGAAGAEKTGGFREHHREALAEIAAIKAHCAGYKGREAEIEESKRQLLDDLLGYLVYKRRTDGEAYRVLKLAFGELPSNASANTRSVGHGAGAAQVVVSAETEAVRAAIRSDVDAVRADTVAATASAEAAAATANRIIAMLTVPAPRPVGVAVLPVRVTAPAEVVIAPANVTPVTRAKAPFRLFGSCCGGDATQVLEPGAAPVREAIPEGARARSTLSAPRAKPSFFRMLGSCCGGDVSLVREPGAAPAREAVPPVTGAGTRVA